MLLSDGQWSLHHRRTIYSEQGLCSSGGGMDTARVFLWLALYEVLVQLLLLCHPCLRAQASSSQ